MTKDEAISGIHSALKDRETADRMKKESTDELGRFCREAKAAGVPITLIASEAGLSRQAVYDLLAEPPSA